MRPAPISPHLPLASFVIALALAWASTPTISSALRPVQAVTCPPGEACKIDPLIKREVQPKKALNGVFVAGNGFWSAQCEVLGEPSHVDMITNIRTAGVVPPEGNAAVPETVHTMLVHRATHGVSGRTGDTDERKKLRRRVEGEIVYSDAGPGDAWVTGSFKVDLLLHIDQAAPNQVENPLGFGIIVIPAARADLTDRFGMTFETNTLTIPKCIPYGGFARTRDDSDWKRVKPNAPKLPSERALHIHFTALPLECVHD